MFFATFIKSAGLESLPLEENSGDDIRWQLLFTQFWWWLLEWSFKFADLRRLSPVCNRLGWIDTEVSHAASRTQAGEAHSTISAGLSHNLVAIMRKTFGLIQSL